MKRWIVSPLASVAGIEKRQRAVNDLVYASDLHKLLVKSLKSLPDLERLLSRMYTYSLKSRVQAFYVDQQALLRIDEFYVLLSTLRKMCDLSALI